MKIDGKIIANAILEDLKKRVSNLKAKNPSTGSGQGIIPKLVIILIDKNPASVAYVNQKEIKGKKIGAKISVKHLSSDVSEPKLLTAIEQFNNDNNVHGIIVQRPLPKNIDRNKVSMAVDPKKDVDGFHSNSKFQPPLALAVLRILEETYWAKSEIRNPKSLPADATHQALQAGETNSNDKNIKSQNKFMSFEHSNFGIVSNFDIRYSNFTKWLKSKKIIVIGKGETGGKPIIEMFEAMNIEPSIIDSKTKNPSPIIKKADIIISAVGKPNVIKPDMLKKEVILIGVGLHKGTDGKMHGDYDEEKIKNIASFYTPTPGGVGPVNVAMLLKNLVTAAENS